MPRAENNFGTAGGTCLCPNGKTYEVSDVLSSDGRRCGFLACGGGTPRGCHPLTDDAPNRNMIATCEGVVEGAAQFKPLKKPPVTVAQDCTKVCHQE